MGLRASIDVAELQPVLSMTSSTVTRRVPLLWRRARWVGLRSPVPSAITDCHLIHMALTE